MVSMTVDLGGPLHYEEFGGSGAPMVLIHGLGGSHLNWMRVGPAFAEQARVLAPDLAGFGRTPPAGRATAVPANRRLLGRFLAEVAGGPAILAGNSMGALLAMMQAVARPETVAGLVLIAPAVPRAPFAPVDPKAAAVFAVAQIPGAGDWLLRRRFERLGPEGIAREVFELCVADPRRIPREVLEAHAEMIRWRLAQPWAARASVEASRSLVRILARRRLFFEQMARIRAPTLVIHGERDRLVAVASLRALAQRRPDWRMEVLEGVGHVPQLEVPETVTALVTTWLRETRLTAG